jgi:P27 family predicted phage terminase small subunit
MVGAKPKSTALKLLEGNPGKRPLPANEPKARVTMPAPPSALSDAARSEWLRIVPEMYELGMMTNLDVPALSAWCEAVSDFYGALVELKTSPATASKRYAGALRRRDAASERLRKWAAEFGFTPSARTRIHAIPKDGEGKEAKDIIGW